MDIRDLGFNPERPEVLDSSRLKDYVDCPSLFYLRHVLGLAPAVLDPKYQAKFDWGTCWHEVLYTYHRTEGNLQAALQALDANYPDYITPQTDKYKRSKERMIKAFFDYLDKWKENLEGLEILRHEQFFDVESEEEGIRWCGRIDSIRRRRSNGRVVVWDYKTASVMGDTYYDGHEVGFQFPGYVWAVNQMMGGGVNEITVDVMYMISKSQDFFQRTFRYDEARIREWVANVKMWQDRINRQLDEHLYDPEAWHKNWNECTRYGRCLYFDVHSISPKGKGRIAILQQGYRENRWEPSDMGDE